MFRSATTTLLGLLKYSPYAVIERERERERETERE